MRAYLNLRHPNDERSAVFRAGLQAAGFDVVTGMGRPSPGDIFLTWNRFGYANNVADQFTNAGCSVVVVENASWGNGFNGESWLHLALNYHNRADCFPVGPEDRWDSLGVRFPEWRQSGETVILMQRGIGPPGVAMPRGWGGGLKGRVRKHPGRRDDIPLEADLAKAGKVITWGSGAAIKALMMGIPVESHMPNWIGGQDNTDAGRLAMFRRLAWAQWRMSEIERGEPFCHLLGI